MTPIAAVQRDLRELTERRRRIGLTVHQLAHIARLRTGRVCRPDGVAMLRLHWALLRLEDGWSIQQVRDATRRGAASGGTREQSSRQAIEYWATRDNTVFAAPEGRRPGLGPGTQASPAAPASAAVAGESTPAGGGGGRRVGDG